MEMRMVFEGRDAKGRLLEVLARTSGPWVLRVASQAEPDFRFDLGLDCPAVPEGMGGVLAAAIPDDRPDLKIELTLGVAKLAADGRTARPAGNIRIRAAEDGKGGIMSWTANGRERKCGLSPLEWDIVRHHATGRGKPLDAPKLAKEHGVGVGAVRSAIRRLRKRLREAGKSLHTADAPPSSHSSPEGVI